MGRKQQSYWAVRCKYLSLSSHMWCSMELLDHPVVIKDNMVFSPALDTCTRAYLRCHGFLKQFSHFTVSSPAVDKPERNVTKLTTNFTNFSPTLHQLAQLFTSFFSTWPSFHHNLTSPQPNSPTSPTFHQNQPCFTNFSPITNCSPTFQHFTLHTSHFTLHFSHLTLRTPHSTLHISSHLTSPHLTSLLLTCHLNCSQLFSSHPSTAQLSHLIEALCNSS